MDFVTEPMDDVNPRDTMAQADRFSSSSSSSEDLHQRLILALAALCLSMAALDTLPITICNPEA